jgi:hypothetical protein
MARMITVNLGCDWPDCYAVAPEGDGVIVAKQLSIDGKQGREFLLCKAHLDEFEQIILPIMAVGIKVEAPVSRASKRTSTETSTGSPISTTQSLSSASSTTIDCRVPDCGRVGEDGFKNNAGLSQHVIKTHGFENLAAYKLIHPDPITT